MRSSVIRELLKLTQQPEMISFAGGLPAPEVFPVEPFREACNRALLEHGKQALQYGTTEGYKPLREWIAQRSASYGILSEIENISITSGSQQALDLVGRLFLNRGDKIVVEEPTYVGALQAWNAYGAEYATVKMDDEGMIPESLEAALRTGPKFIYVLPNFQNPSGATLSLERRKILVELADKYGVPIIEDDPYGQLRFEGEHIPPVIVLDSEYRNHGGNVEGGNVLYMSTFSKILAPGIRLAWVIGPTDVIRKLVLAKQGADLHTSTFNQLAAYELAKTGLLNEHVKLIRNTYKERRDMMMESMAEFFPSGTRWTHPKGGMFLFGYLPENLDATDIFKRAVEKKVAFVPGAAFHPNGGGENTMRLNFSYSTPEIIREGIQRLGLAIKEAMKEK
jgi:2-aminoadipate transaminase